MDLFAPDPSTNLLPHDGIVNYHGVILQPAKADHYYTMLLDGISWRHDEVVMMGKRLVTARKVAWHGDGHLSYTYSGAAHHALPWTMELHELKALVEQHSGERFNSCLLNLYHNGEEGMGWHSDDEKSIIRDSAIASLSFGAERRFCFKHKRTGETTEITLEHGALLVMKGSTQTHWLHSAPKMKRITTPRINLTFRAMADQG